MIASIKCGESQVNMSCDDGVLGSTVHGWLRDKEKLRVFVDMLNSTDWIKRKKARIVKDTQLYKVVSHGL